MNKIPLYFTINPLMNLLYIFNFFYCQLYLLSFGGSDVFFLNDECSVLFLCKPEFSEKMKPHLLRFLQGWCVDWHSLDFWRAGVLAGSVENFPWLPSSQQHMTHLWLTQHLSHHQTECSNPFPTSPHSKAKAVFGEHWDLWQRPQHSLQQWLW